MNDIHLFSEGITICEESFGRMRANQWDSWHISTSSDPNFLFAIFVSWVEIMKNGRVPGVNLYANILSRSASVISLAVDRLNQSDSIFSDFWANQRFSNQLFHIDVIRERSRFIKKAHKNKMCAFGPEYSGRYHRKRILDCRFFDGVLQLRIVLIDRITVLQFYSFTGWNLLFCYSVILWNYCSSISSRVIAAQVLLWYDESILKVVELQGIISDNTY